MKALSIISLAFLALNDVAYGVNMKHKKIEKEIKNKHMV